MKSQFGIDPYHYNLENGDSRETNWLSTNGQVEIRATYLPDEKEYSHKCSFKACGGDTDNVEFRKDGIYFNGKKRTS